MQSQGHLATGQVGLRGHSYDDETTLTKHYLVEVRSPAGGWVGVKSYESIMDAGYEVMNIQQAGKWNRWSLKRPSEDVRVFDNYKREVI